MAVVGDVFGLNSVYAKQVENVENSNFASWPESNSFGYFSGGETPGKMSHIHKLDFSNDSITFVPSALPVATSRHATFTSNLYGYYGGGLTPASPPYVNVVGRLDFSSDTLSLPGNNLASAKERLSVSSSNSYGYFGGGYSFPPVVYYCNIDRLDISNETISNPGNLVPGVGKRDMTTVESSSHGYFAGGSTSPVVCTVSRIDFTTETLTDLASGLPTTNVGARGVSNQSHGYFMGGYSPSAPGILCTIARLDFTSETMSLPGNGLPTKTEVGATSSSGSFGYYMGGNLPGNTCTIFRLDFSNETLTNPGSGLSIATRYGAATSGVKTRTGNGNKNYGYFGGGYDGGFVSLFKRLDMSTDSSSTLTTRLSSQRSALKGIQSNNYGYFIGGYGPPGGTYVQTMDRFDFSNDGLNTSPVPFVTMRTTLWAVDDMYAWKGGDNYPSGGTTQYDVKRLDFQTESWSVPGTNLSDRGGEGGVFSDKSNSHGYHLGGTGWTPTVNYYPKTLLKYDTKSDTSTFTLNVLPLSQRNVSSIQSNQYGYYGGGNLYPPNAQVCTIHRLEFSTETSSDSGAFCHRHSWGAYASGVHYGYMGQGQPASPPPFAIDFQRKLDFSTDSPSNIPNIDGAGKHSIGSFQNGI